MMEMMEMIDQQKDTACHKISISITGYYFDGDGDGDDGPTKDTACHISLITNLQSIYYQLSTMEKDNQIQIITITIADVRETCDKSQR